MQIEFLTSKENFLKLYIWVKDNICDLVVRDCKTKRELDESELYQAEVGYSKKNMLYDKRVCAAYNGVLLKRVLQIQRRALHRLLSRYCLHDGLYRL